MDGRLIIQVLVNLLDNAVKNTEEGGHIRLSVSFQEGKAYFVVEDDGRGIEPGKEQQIFGEFISLGGKGPDQKHGIGLGLAICQGGRGGSRRQDLGGKQAGRRGALYILGECGSGRVTELWKTERQY